jgi:hypothetical protein
MLDAVVFGNVCKPVETVVEVKGQNALGERSSAITTHSCTYHYVVFVAARLTRSMSLVYSH